MKNQKERDENYLKTVRERMPRSQEVVWGIAKHLTKEGYVVSVPPSRMAQNTSELNTHADNGDLRLTVTAEVKQRPNHSYVEHGVNYFRIGDKGQWIRMENPELIFCSLKTLRKFPEPARIYIVDHTGRRGYYGNVKPLKKAGKLRAETTKDVNARYKDEQTVYCHYEYLTYFDMDKDNDDR